MVNSLGYIATAAAAYLLGSIPTGFLVARSRGIDIRTVGSGNIGGTNPFRSLGKPAGIFVLAADGLKGWLACGVVAGKFYEWFGGPGGPETIAQEYFAVIAGLAAILGHNYTCWLNFKGGKGIATSAGVLAALVPWALVVILTVWVIVFLASRFVSLASIAAALSLPLATWILGYGDRKLIITSLMTALAVYKHKANIQRLLKGKESRVDFKKSQPGPAA